MTKDVGDTLVLDCSIVMSWCFADESTPATEAILASVSARGVCVPALWHWEVGNALLTAMRRRRISRADAAVALEMVAAIPTTIDEMSHRLAWSETRDLAEAHGLSVYDAAYLELALRRKAALATKDDALRRAAIGAGLAVLP